MEKTKLAPEHGQEDKAVRRHNSLKLRFLNLVIYLSGLGTLAAIIADPFTMSTYFSDNSLLPGVVNREFSLKTEADYYLAYMRKIATGREPLTFFESPALKNFIKSELDNFGLKVYEQSFSYIQNEQLINGTNIYSVLRGERSASAEAIALCAPLKSQGKSNTLPSVALTLALMKYFSTKSYWAKDVIVIFVDHDFYGTSAWLDSYYDVHYSTHKRDGQSFPQLFLPNTQHTYYESLEERSGPMQASLVLELYDSQFTRMNIKIHGLYGQLPNLDLFNLAVELAARESVTPYFHGKSLPFAQTSEELYYHHLETAMAFMKSQGTMQADGLHGLFLKYAVQSLTLQCSQLDESGGKSHILASLLNAGRMVEGIMRSLNNLTERFNRSYYFYIILSLRRFTSIGYYMIPFGLITSPLLIRTLFIYLNLKDNTFIGVRAIILLTVALVLSLLSCFNISAALIKSIVVVPFLFII